MRNVYVAGLLLAILLVIGCGGHGGLGTTGGGTVGGDPWQLGDINGHIEMPPAMPKVPGTLTVTTQAGSSPVNADGTFTVKGYMNSPGLAIVSDALDNPVGMAYISSAESRIDAAAQARALTYLGLQGQFLPPQARLALWNELKNLPEVAAIASDVGGVGGLIATNKAAVQASVHNHLEPMLARLRLDPPPSGRGIVVDPGAAKSGIQVVQQALSEIVVRNNIRRRAHAFVDRIQVTTESGDVEPRNDRIADFPIDAISQPTSVSAFFGDFGTLLGDGSVGSPAFTSNVAWVPTQTAPLNLPLTPTNAKRTKYRLIVVGPGTKGYQPDGLTQEMRQKQDEVVRDALLLDAVMPTVFAVLGPLLDKVPDTVEGRETANFVILQYKDVMAALMADAQISAKIDAGDFAGAGSDITNFLLTSEAAKAAMLRVAGELIRQANNGQVTEAMESFAKKVQGIFTAVDVTLQGLDTINVMSKWGTYNAFEDFTVDVNKDRVLLNPPHGKVAVTQSIDLTASVPNATGEESPLLRYKWTLTSSIGVQLKSATETGSSFTTSAPTVKLESYNHQTGTVTVEVEALVVNPGSEVSLGKAKSTVEVVNDKVVLTPAKSSIHRNSTQTLKVKINNPTANSHYLFKWSCSNASGSINVTGSQATATREVVYTSGNAEGSDTITVEAYQNGESGLVKIGSSTATVLVEDQATIIPATFRVITYSSGTSAQEQAIVTCQRVPGATSYRLVGTGGYDFAYYGDRINFVMGPYVEDPAAGWVEPEGEFWVGLSTWYGGVGSLGANVAYDTARFGGFSFYVEVTR